jgi:tetratricopeptide (TPR) repeat protein/class 3 adenylate cyclase/tRNA A-37 threonylcarbamoyl transferase component Bud32
MDERNAPSAGVALEGVNASLARWTRLQDVFAAAVACEGEERRALLDRECRDDPELRKEVESLIAAHERAGAVDELSSRLSAPARWRARVDAEERQGRRVGRYLVLEQLGAGGMGVVYKARDEQLNRHVALKFLSPHLSAREDAKQRFLVEARAVARLDHPNICAIHEIGEAPDGRLFLSMPLYAGETLQHRLERTPVLAFAEAATIALQIARGLASAHEHGIVHRDVKPSNIMLLADGGVKVLDFGVARVDDALFATHEGIAPGTAAYMSPEQTRGLRVDVRTDVWSLGVVLYEMLAGERPFGGESAHALRSAVLAATPAPLTDKRADVPVQIDALLRSALAKDPADRYPTAGRLADDLSALSERQDAAAKSIAGGDALVREAERRRAAVLVCTLAEYDALVEQLAPERLEHVMSLVRGAAVEIVRKHGGLVNHTLDQEIVALFGAPATHEDDDLRAVRAAAELLARMKELNKELAASLGREFASISLRCGLHSGVLVTRRLNAGPQRYAIAGRPMQVASQLAAFAAPNTILVSPECARLVAPFVVAQPHESVAIDAGSTPITAYRIVGDSGLQTRLEAAVRKGLTPLAGRSAELALVEMHYLRARAGEGHVVLIAGEAGVGKSRLLHELRARIVDGDARVLQARCFSYGAAPYMPFAQILREALHVKAADAAAASEIAQRLRELDPSLEQFAPLYMHLLSMHGDAQAQSRQLRGERLRESASEAVAAFLVCLARKAPVILLFEDWHWSDEGSNETLRRLLEVAASHALFVVITTRPEGLSSMGAASQATRIQLAPLGFDAALAVMRSVLSAEAVPTDLAQRIYERSGGNPLFIEEVCQTLLARNAVAPFESDALEAVHIPETIQAVVRTRLDGLDKDALEALRVASVIGREFTRDVLADVGAGVGQTSLALELLQNSGLIQQVGVTPEVSYRFKHAITQEVTYDSLLAHQRRRIHDDVGRALERRDSQRAGERPALLAYHFTCAEVWEPAVRYGRLAAERASALSQFTDALQLLDRVQRCIEHLPEDAARRDLRADVLLQQERLCETLGQRGRQQQLIAELIALLAPSGPSGRLGLAYLRQGDLLTLLKRFDGADRALSTALRMSREQGDAVLERNTLRSIGLLRWHEERHEEALAITQSALAIDRERSDELAVAGDLANLGVIYKSRGDYARAIASFEEALSMPAFAQDPSTLVYSLQNVANVHRELGNLDRALEYLQQGNEISQARLLPIQRSFHLMAIAHVLLQQGRVEESLQTYRESIELSRRAHHADGLVQSLRALGEVLFTLGRDAEATPLLEEAAQLFAHLEDHVGEVEMWSRVAALLERAETPASAIAIWTKVRELHAALGDARGELTALEGAARAARKASAPREQAIALATAALTLATAVGDPRRELALRNTLGILQWESGRYESALACYEIALALARTLGDRAAEGLMLNSMGVTLQRLDRCEEARTVLEQSVALNRQAGEVMLEAYALAALGEVRQARGAVREARECYDRSLALRRELGDSAGERRMLERLALLEE